MKGTIRFEEEYASRGFTLQYSRCFVDDQDVGMEIAEFPQNIFEENSTTYYHTHTPCRTKRQASDLSVIPKDEEVHMCDEFWWTEDECGDAWFPTFGTIEQLIAFHEKQQRPRLVLKPRKKS